jgi:hypothetical protein
MPGYSRLSVTTSFRAFVLVLPLELQFAFQVGVALFEPGHVLLPEFQSQNALCNLSRISTKVPRSGRATAASAACAAFRARLGPLDLGLRLRSARRWRTAARGRASSG